jgi:hypothetical protein
VQLRHVRRSSKCSVAPFSTTSPRGFTSSLDALAHCRDAVFLVKRAHEHVSFELMRASSTSSWLPNLFRPSPGRLEQAVPVDMEHGSGGAKLLRALDDVLEARLR